MIRDEILGIFQEAINLIIICSSPMLIAALIVGLIVAVFQATTQIQEQTLAFVPKMITIFIVLMLTGPWMLELLEEYTVKVFEFINTIMLRT